MARMAVFHQNLPKAELHVHLEGSLEPETLCELDPDLRREEIDSRYRYSCFADFLASYKWAVGYLREPAHFALAARRLLDRLAAENVLYAEINLSVGVMLRRAQRVAPIYDAVIREAASSKVEAWWIFDAVRQFGVEEAMKVARLAAERAGDRVVGFGVGGDEAAIPAEQFAGVFQFARQAGLRLVPHAGETCGPESVWGALRLGADRIGHGIRSAEDPALLRFLRDRRIPLEVSLTSNVCTGAVPSIHQHPIRRLVDAGVSVILNTDDPAMFRTTLSREYELAEQIFQFSREEIENLARNGFEFASRRPAYQYPSS